MYLRGINTVCPHEVYSLTLECRDHDAHIFNPPLRRRHKLAIAPRSNHNCSSNARNSNGNSCPSGTASRQERTPPPLACACEHCRSEVTPRSCHRRERDTVQHIPPPREYPTERECLDGNVSDTDAVASSLTCILLYSQLLLALHVLSASMCILFCSVASGELTVVREEELSSPH